MYVFANFNISSFARKWASVVAHMKDIRIKLMMAIANNFFITILV